MTPSCDSEPSREATFGLLKPPLAFQAITVKDERDPPSMWSRPLPSTASSSSHPVPQAAASELPLPLSSSRPKRPSCPVDDDLLPASKRLNLTDVDAPTPKALPTQVKEVGDVQMSNSGGWTDDEDECPPRISRAAKGKAKMRPMPELPEEVWKRVFELYYDQCADGE